MSKERGLLIFFGIISAILTILCLFFGIKFFDKKPNSYDENQQNYMNNFTNSNMAGKYYYRDVAAVDAEGKNNPTEYALTLYENGLFKYQLNDLYAPVGAVGNYTINKNALILNVLFNTGSSTDIDITGGIKRFTIDSDYNLIGSVKSKDANSLINVNFSKTTNEVDEFNISNFLLVGVHGQNELADSKM